MDKQYFIIQQALINRYFSGCSDCCRHVYYDPSYGIESLLFSRSYIDYAVEYYLNPGLKPALIL